MSDSTARLLTFQQIHEVGARRHGSRWLAANSRAVEAMLGTKLKVYDPHVKRTVSEIVLRVLDGLRVDNGEWWDKERGQWTTR